VDRPKSKTVIFPKVPLGALPRGTKSEIRRKPPLGQTIQDFRLPVRNH